MQSILAHLFIVASFIHLSFPTVIEAIHQPENDTKNEVEHLSRRLSHKSPWFSNIAPSTSGPMIGPIYRIDCRRGWCEEKRVHALDYYVTEVDGAWTPWFSSSYLGQQACPSDTLVTQVECSGPRCYGMRLKCSRVLDSYFVSETRIIQTDSFSEELSGYGKCPDGFYLQGMKCSGDYCDNITLICAKVKYNFHPMLLPSRWFSGKSFPFSSGITSNPIYRVDCRGGWCSEKRVHTFDFYGMVLEKRGTWTPWFYSKNQSAQQVCPNGSLVTQIQCGGEKCGKMRIRCGEILSYDRDVILSVDNDNVIETGYFSEEGEGYGECPTTHLLVGMKCEGKSCDNTSLLCASISIRHKKIDSAFDCSRYYCDDDDF